MERKRCRMGLVGSVVRFENRGGNAAAVRYLMPIAARPLADGRQVAAASGGAAAPGGAGTTTCPAGNFARGGNIGREGLLQGAGVLLAEVDLVGHSVIAEPHRVSGL